MQLPSGTRIGSFEIVAPLGAGGMGEVYRATDTRLDRSVAIKALPQAFATDAERLARFEREAKLLASLNHPNIAAIYGIEDLGETPCLVLELIEGETLALKLARGPLPLREALEIGVQIAAAIEAAHERGVVHRDLKPGNIMVTPARAVKVLDFGLAKAGGAGAGETGSQASLSMSPTAAIAMTGQGLVVGTAPYMSPEQARGREVDRGTDVWAFGCVLYEMLTGRPVFAGETVSDVIARILEREPDWSALPATAPPRLRDVIARCLTKDVAARPRDIGDLRRELAAILQQSSSGSMPAARETPSLAVLYFENLAHDPESDYFCAGITEDIVTDLSKIKGLRVASRNAVARYRGTAPDVAQVARELNVKAVLEGSVRRAGGRVRITAQLVNAADGFHLWAERYDRTLEDVFAVQEEIASSIAQALRVALSPAEVEAMGQNKPADVEAYDLYLRGRERYGVYTKESIAEALDLFQQAIAIDPDYALAWAGVADCHGQNLQWSFTEDPEEEKRLGLEAARRAVALNPNLPEAHKSEALMLRFTGDLAGARAANLRAVEVNPRFAPALINIGVDTFCRGDVAGAERVFRHCVDLDPQEDFGKSWISSLCEMTRRHDEAVSWAEQFAQRRNSAPWYFCAQYAARASRALHAGDFAAALAAIAEADAQGAEPGSYVGMRAAVLAYAGQVSEARAVLEQCDRASLTGLDLQNAAVAALRLGDVSRARAYMSRKAMFDLGPMIIRLDPRLHPLLDDPAFAPVRFARPLVWPIEAPMMEASLLQVFDHVRVDTGRPAGSNVLPKA